MCILAGGRSKNVCIYNVKESILLKKYEITQNRSLDGVDVSNNIYHAKCSIFFFYYILNINAEKQLQNKDLFLIPTLAGCYKQEVHV